MGEAIQGKSSGNIFDTVGKISGSGDVKLIAILVAATFIIGVLGILMVPFISAQDRSGDYVDYMATLHPDGTLDESYTYHLTGNVRTRMLFRYWKDELDFGNSYLPFINLVSVDAPSGTIAYIKNWAGQVTIVPPSYGSVPDIITINELAYTNEVGCYYPNYFPAGSHTISFKFKINLEAESDSAYDHLNLMLARAHLPYRNVMIVLEDANYISSFYQHPPSLYTSRVGNNIVILGSSAENELLEVELLMPTGTHRFDTYLSDVSNIKGLTDQANSLYSTQY